MKTTENNKLIAIFMGVIPTSTKYTKNWYNGQELSDAGLPFACGAMGNGTDEPKFATSWDWLMPVVEKIESEGIDVIINTCTCVINDVGQDRFDNIDSFGKTKIEATYKAVTEFIKWYNEQDGNINQNSPESS